MIKWCALFVFLLFGVAGYGQTTPFFFANAINNRQLPARALTVEDGLPQGFINGIVQDDAGFIWMGTGEGLARYDGNSIKTFRANAADSNTLAGNFIKTIYKDRENQIWIIYTNNAIDLLNPVTEKVRHLSKEPAFAALVKTGIGTPFGLVQDGRHQYWGITDNWHLFYFNLIDPTPRFVALPAGERAFSVKAESDGIWVLTNKALYVVHRGLLKKMTSLPKPVSITSPAAYSATGTMVRDKHRHWIVGGQGVVQIYDETKDSWQTISTGDRVNRFFSVASDGSVYFNSGDLLCRLNHDHSLSVVWESKPGGFISLMTDRTDVLWVGTNTFGARLINLRSSGFRSFPYQHGFSNDVLAQWLHLPPTAGGWQAADPYLSRWATDKKGRLWMLDFPDATFNERTCLLRSIAFPAPAGPGHSTTPIRNEISDLPFSKNIAFDYRDSCWTTLPNGDLARIDITAKKLYPLRRLHQTDSQPVYLAAFAQKLCIVYPDMIRTYDPSTGRIQSYGGVPAFKNTMLLMATADPQYPAVLWLATMGNGIIRIDTRSGQIKTFMEKDGIPSNTVYGIIADGHGRLWCSSNKGIFRFNTSNYSVISFTAKNGLQGNEFNRYHFMKLPDGHLLFGGTQGWTALHPDSITTDQFQPPVFITEIMVNNVAINQLPQWKDRAVTDLKQLQLSHDQGFVSFYFSALQYNDVTGIRYQYKLDGVDKNWVRSGNRNMANYTSLPPGRYRFQVQCTNTAGLWSPHTKTILITISQPWWNTWWANIIMAVIIGGIVGAVYRSRMNLIRTRQQMWRKQQETDHLRDLDEMKDRFFSNITHEFRTPLSLILAPIDELKDNTDTPAAVKKSLLLIQQNAQQLSSLINQLLDLSKLESGNMKTAFSGGDLHAFIAGCVQRMEPLAVAKSVNLHYTATGPDCFFLFDGSMLEKIVYNLLSNAIKFTPASGTINVLLTIIPAGNGKHEMQLKVTDTGIGIPAEKITQIFNRFYQADDAGTHPYAGTGIGLALVKELTGLLNGTVSVESVLGSGTTFTIKMPLHQAMAPPAVSTEEDIGANNGQVLTPPGSGALILIVEDNSQLLELIAGAFRTRYRVLMAPDGKAGFTMAQAELPDLIISDVMMPEMDGYTLCRQIKDNAKTSHIGFMLLSAKASHHSVMDGLRSSADDYIAKPFQMDELKQRVYNLLARQEQLRAYHYHQFTNPKEEIRTGAENNEFLKQLYVTIDEHISDSALNVTQLAGLMAMSQRTLNRKLATLVGLSANEVLKQYRLKKAAALLKQGYKISDVAYRAGFDTPSYFSASFKTFYGVTPSEYTRRGF